MTGTYEINPEAQAHRSHLKNECSDEALIGARNMSESMVLRLAENDESRIKLLGGMAIDGRIDPENTWFLGDLELFFADKAKARTGFRVAQYYLTPDAGVGKIERFIRRSVHPSIRPYVDIQ
jgi:hypothetical protein